MCDFCGCGLKMHINIMIVFCALNNNVYLSDFVKTWSPGFRLAPGKAWVQASPASEIVGGLASWSVQLHSPGTALTAGGWIRPGDQS